MKITLSEAVSLFQTHDGLAIPLATGQPMGLLNALDERKDWKQLEIFTGLLSFPYPLLLNPKVFVTSGYYGPIERFLNEKGANMEFLPANFTGFEIFARKKKFRVISATLSPPDADGYLTFGTHSGAGYKPFIAANQASDQIAIAEVNARMPVVYGSKELGDNKIHIDELQYYFEAEQTQISPPPSEMTEAEKKIADFVLDLIPSGATLQFGIGPVPNQIAALLAESSLGDFGIHSELISDGFLKLHEAGKISNRHKAVFKDQSVFTFAFGSQALYDFLDERNGKNRRQAIALPVSVVNDPAFISKNENLVAINSGLMVDFAGQVCSEAIGLRQYSGVGGQLSFIQGAYEARDGRGILCIKSTATIGGKTVSNILPVLPPGSLVSVPRYYTHFIVTEYGVADLYGISDEKRAQKLIEIAHPDFREDLQKEYEAMKKHYYKI